MARRLVCFAVLAWLGSAACATPPAAEGKPKVPVAPSTQTVESELYRALVALEPGPAIVEALPSEQRARLQAQLDGLTAAERELLLQGSDPIVALRPLLYLLAGGRDLEIQASLFRSPAAVDELVGLGGGGPIDGLLVASNALAERAAREVLRARAVDLRADVEHRAEHLEQVAFAANVIERSDIERLALRELAEHHPSPVWELSLARLAARELDVTTARAHFDRAREAGAHERSAVLFWLEAAETLRATETNDAATAVSIEHAVQRARAYLVLGQPEQALRELDPHAAARSGHLGLATTHARARTGASACPKLRAVTLANDRLCREAWAAVLASEPLDALQLAWFSGEGRDELAVESYLGLSYVVPLMYGLNARGSAADVIWVRSALDSIERAALDAVAVAPHFEAIAALAHALGVALEVAQSGGADRLPQPARQALLDRAAKLSTRLGRDPWGQAAVLGIAAMLSREERLAPLLDGFVRADGSSEVTHELETTFGALVLWDVLADRAAERFTAARSLFGEIATSHESSSFERSHWLCSWAEAEAHLFPGDGSYRTLRQIVEKLSDERVPLDMRLRAHLDLAGLSARRGDLPAAATTLEAIVMNTPRGAVTNHDEQELLIAATGYLLIVRGLLARGEERKEYASQLESLVLDVSRAAAAPPTLRLWLALWRSEFDTLIAIDACAGAAACEKKAAASRGTLRGGLDQALGARSAALLRNGILPVGGVQIELRHLANGRLSPNVRATPRFLLAHPPPLE